MINIKPIIIIVIFFVILSCSDKSEKQNKKVSTPLENSVQSAQSIDELFNAALDGKLEIVESYIENGFDVNQPNQENKSLLMLASFNGHILVCQYLIKAGAHAEARDPDGRTALMFASTGPFAETVKFLLSSDANPNSVDHGEHFSSLMHAAAEGHIDVVKVLLDNGADKTLKDIDGDTAESFAKQNGHLAVADYIKGYK